MVQKKSKHKYEYVVISDSKQHVFPTRKEAMEFAKKELNNEGFYYMSIRKTSTGKGSSGFGK